MKKLKKVPNLSEIIDYYGNPGQIHEDPNFADNLKKFKSPFPLRLSWDPHQKAVNLVLHKKVGDVVIDALQEILDYKGHNYLIKNMYDMYGGGYQWRMIRGSNRLSTHAYGISIDLNPHLGPYTPDWKEGDKGMQPDFIVDAFEKRGFVNLPWDMMHFQACKHPMLK